MAFHAGKPIVPPLWTEKGVGTRKIYSNSLNVFFLLLLFFFKFKNLFLAVFEDNEKKKKEGEKMVGKS